MSQAGGAVAITIPQGALRGRKLKTPSGRPYSSFQGIPYAKPPIGPLRFLAPESPEKWSGIRNATKEANMAPQIDSMMRQQTEHEGDEDCLYLNIYTPKLPTGGKMTLIPVMVWIHGGGYSVGSGNTEIYGPEYLMEHDVVFVTINYRLGALGFFSTGDELVPGNAGLKDQVMALKWVRSNIANFAGDPGNVTIFGESAGSASCQLLMLSSATKGLFHRVICQSGVATRGLVSSATAKDRSLRLARSLGFSGNSSEELLAYMREQPATKLVENASEALTKEEKLRMDTQPFGPTIEPVGVQDSIVTRDPLEILKSGEFNLVPTIIGVNSREGLLYRQRLLDNKSAIRELNANFQLVLPANLPVHKGGRVSVARDVKRFYFGNQPLEESTADVFGDLRAEVNFVYFSLLSAKVQSSLPTAKPIYFYHFDAVTELNVFKKQVGGEELSGASHGDDLLYLFSSEKTKDMAKGPDSSEGKTITRMTRLWTNFAKTGNPTPFPVDSLLSVTWPPFKKDDRCYLDINNDGLIVKKDLMEERMDFWEKIYRH